MFLQLSATLTSSVAFHVKENLKFSFVNKSVSISHFYNQLVIMKTKSAKHFVGKVYFQISFFI